MFSFSMEIYPEERKKNKTLYKIEQKRKLN